MNGHQGAAVPDITLVVPTCNAARHLEPLLVSLMGQDPPAQRILVVDDASTDGTVALARELGAGRVEVFDHRERLGLAGNWNRAAALVETSYFAVAHQDDVYAPAFVGALVAALDRDKAAGAAHCRATAIDDAGSPIPSPAEAYKRGLWRAALRGAGAEAVGSAATPRRTATYRALLRGNFVACPSVVHRTAAFRELGGYREGLRFVADWEYTLRLVLEGWGLAAVDRELVAYRRHDHRATEQEMRTLNRYREELELLRWAQRVGVEAGLLERGAPLSAALRHNVVFDAFRDLERGRRADAEAKLAFLDEHAPEEASTRIVRLVRRLMEMGWPGRKALGVGLSVVLLGARLRDRNRR